MTGKFAAIAIIPTFPVLGTASVPVQMTSEHRLDELNKSMIKSKPPYNPVGVGVGYQVRFILQVRLQRQRSCSPPRLLPFTKFKVPPRSR